MNKSDRYLITGGTGFIGSHITNKLIKQGKEVYVLALSDEYNWRLENADKVHIKYIDITNFTKLKKIIEDIDPTYIFHLAAYVNVKRDLNAINKAIEVNLKGTLNLLWSLNNIDYNLFINTGTCEEYGIGTVPFQENQREHPVSPYSFSKTSATHLCEMFSNIYNNPIVTVRPFLTYGPKQTSDMLIPQLIYSGIEEEKFALTPGEQTRDLIFVKDVANAYIKFSNNYDQIEEHKIFNIGSGTEIKIKRIVDIISDFFPNNKFEIGELSYRKGEKMNFYSSIDKIKSFLDWEPENNFKEGIEKTISWYRNNIDKLELD